MKETMKDFPLEVRLFGGFEVRVQGEPLPPLRSRREQWLLALLALRHEKDTARDWLATTLWADAEESQALFYLRKALSNLRSALGPESGRLLSPTSRAVRLDLKGAFADFAALEAAASSATVSKADMERGVEVYTGALMPECNEDWIVGERQRLAQIHLVLLERLAALALEGGEPAEAARWLRRVVAADSYREHAYRQLMQALADCGDAAAVTHVYRELRLRLHADLNTSPAPETEELYKRLQKQSAAAVAQPAAPTATASRRHLPVPLTDLIGREAEIEEITGWLSRRRLVTLLGSGGIGKTRLAIAVGEALLTAFPDGVWFVDFAAVSEPQQVPVTVTKALGLPDTPGILPEDALAQRLATQNILLIFDNCEHLLDATAALGYALLSACPDLRILATSRQALGVTGEQALPVSPLAFPPTQKDSARIQGEAQEKDPHVLMEYPAIRLFVERAVQSLPTFRLTRKNQGSVAAIVQELDGIPLAIEMAAARLRSFSLNEIEARLADRFRLLTTGNRSARPRHQTLRATLDWSHDLLSEAEKRLLRRLSVFTGGWTLDAAVAVCFEEDGADIAERCAELHALLVEKSLILRDNAEDDPRFSMLATLREYAAERLESSGEAHQVQRRHLTWFRTLAEAYQNGLNGDNDAALMAKMDREYGNVRSAIAFAGTGEQCREGMELLVFLHSYWIERGMMREGFTQCRALLDSPFAQDRTAERADVLRSAGWLAHYQNNYSEAERFGEECREICRELGDSKREAKSLSLLAAVSGEQGKNEQACAFIAESLAIWREAGNLRLVANTLNIQGEILQIMGDLAGARASIMEALAIRREQDADYGIAASLYALGRVYYEENDLAQAEICCRESLLLFQQSDAPFWVSSMQIQLGWIAIKQERFAEGIAFCREGLEAQRTIENAQFTAYGLDALAEAASRFGEWERVARLHGASDKLRRDSRCFVMPMERKEHERQSLAAQNALGKASYHQFAAQSADFTLSVILLLTWD